MAITTGLGSADELNIITLFVMQRSGVIDSLKISRFFSLIGLKSACAWFEDALMQPFALLHNSRNFCQHMSWTVCGEVRM